MLDLESLVQTKEPTFDDENAEIDLSRLSAKDRDAVMARVTPDDSAPPDAFALSQNEIRREMMDRGIQPKGFYNDDAARLQEEFKKEHAAEKESRMHTKIQTAARLYLKETVHKRQMERERELREEVGEIARDARLEVWLDLVKTHATPSHATLRLSSIGTRALCKNLVFNHSLHSLSLCRNGLDDSTGKHLAMLLKRNTTLKRLELESNQFGPLTARELGDALCQNQTIVLLNLESNPLTDDEKDFSGIIALGTMLTRNTTLQSLNLWRTRLGIEGGKHIAQGMERNQSLLCLDIGNNRISMADGMRIDQQLTKNRIMYEQGQDQHVELRKAQLQAAEAEKQRQIARAREIQQEQWINERKLERAQERAEQEKVFQQQKQMEEDRLRQIAARKATEFAARLEMEKKKKGGKKKGGKKKK